MTVAINSTRKTVEISWNTEGSGSTPNPPEGFPSHPIVLPPEGGAHPEHPIFLPPYIDNSLPGDQPRPDQGLPGDQPEIDAGFPADQPEIDNSLPGDQPQVNPLGGAVEAVQVFAQGQDGDWSNTAVMPNDGLAALAYPQDFKGESYIEVRALDGSLVDSGTISVT